MSAAGVKTSVAALFTALLLAVTAACTGGDGSSPSPSSSSPSGAGGTADVLAVKIDNVA